MNRIKQYILVGLMSFGLLIVAAPASVAVYAATPTQSACKAIGSDATCSTNANSGLKISTVIKVVINILSLIIGVVAVIMIIVSGLKYITSGGDSNSVSSAKNTLIYAIVGLVIVAMAQFIVQFVLQNLEK